MIKYTGEAREFVEKNLSADLLQVEDADELLLAIDKWMLIHCFSGPLEEPNKFYDEAQRIYDTVLFLNDEE